MIAACHSCQFNGKGDPRCIKCRRVSQDDIRISKTPHTRSEMVVASSASEASPNVTNLDPAVEDTLRKAMASFWALDPIQLLCVQHMMLRKRLSTVGETLREVHAKIGKYRGSERAQAGMMRDAIAKRIPMLAPIINAHVKEDGTIDAHHMTELMDEMPAGDLFEAAGTPLDYDPLKRRTRR